MKNIIHQIKKAWWKHFNPERYYEEVWNDAFARLSDYLGRNIDALDVAIMMALCTGIGQGDICPYFEELDEKI